VSPSDTKFLARGRGVALRNTNNKTDSAAISHSGGRNFAHSRYLYLQLDISYIILLLVVRVL
jgi:hypothetical protein